MRFLYSVVHYKMGINDLSICRYAFDCIVIDSVVPGVLVDL